MVSPTTPAQSELLTSWKDIANYLGKGVRTVQRWEQQFGLPVRRPIEKSRGIVHATRGELDRWLNADWSMRGTNGSRISNAEPTMSEAVRATIRRSVELRDTNRRLMTEFTRSLNIVFQGCQSLAQSLNRPYHHD